MVEKACFLCETQVCEACLDCNLVYSCQNHLQFHRTQDNTKCYPWRVGKVESKGRVLIATRDIEPLELVMDDKPVGLSPLQDSPILCLNCFRLLGDSPEYYCQCGFPMCNADCSKGKSHQIECKIYCDAEQKMKDRTDYQLILPMRMLTEIDNNSILKSRVDLLMDHESDRQQETDNWNWMHNNVVIPIRDRLKKSEWTPEMIQRAVGITRTNGLQVVGIGGTTSGKNGFEEHFHMEDSEIATVRVLHPTMSLMSNSCIQNIRIINRSKYSLDCRALRKILCGEELTITYTEFLCDGPSRKTDTKKNWFFSCTCPRCQDPTDLGSFSDSLLCKQCSSPVTQTKPDEPNSDWSCEKCKSSYPSAVTQPLLAEAKLGLNGGPSEDGELTSETVAYYENYLQSQQGVLHPNHSFILRAKIKLIYAYKKVTEKLMSRKVELCQDVLKVMDKIAPGYSGTRGLLLYELSAPMAAILEKDFQAGNINKEQFIQGLSNVLTVLTECMKCLEVEDSGSYSRKMCGYAEAVHKNLSEIIEFAEYL